MKRRTLVLTDDIARHPFLAGLPPHARQAGEIRPLPRSRWPFSLTSVREFLMAYCACFLAVSLFIA
jgi:hypothetical protein